MQKLWQIRSERKNAKQGGTQVGELQDIDIDLPTNSYEIPVTRGQFPIRELRIIYPVDKNLSS